MPPEQNVEQKKLIIAAFLATLTQLHSIVHQQEIRTHLIISLKYVLLDLWRKEHHLKNASLQALEDYKQHHAHIKYQIYACAMDDLTSYLLLLNSEPLKKLLYQLEKNPDLLLQQLKSMQRKQYQAQRDFEMGFQKKILCAQHTTIKTFIFSLYRHSFINLSESFFSWLGKAAFTTFISKKIPPALPKIMSIIGIIIGLYYTYMVGVMNFLCVLMLHKIAQTAYHLFSKNTVDDFHAMIIKKPLSRYIQLTVTDYFRLVVFLTIGLETLYLKNREQGIYAMGGFSISMAILALASRYNKKLRLSPNQLPTDNQIFVRLLLVYLGDYCGQIIMGIGLNIKHNNEVRAQVLKQLQLLENKTMVGDVAVNFYSDTGFHLEWRNVTSGFFYRTQCSVNETQRAIHCDNVTTHAPRLH